jgi:hypothetical protein
MLRDSANRAICPLGYNAQTAAALCRNCAKSRNVGIGFESRYDRMLFIINNLRRIRNEEFGTIAYARNFVLQNTSEPMGSGTFLSFDAKLRQERQPETVISPESSPI